MKISVIIPCYNEEKSVRTMYERLTSVFREKLPNYDYELIFVDDFSPDDTRVKLREICKEDPAHVKAVFNARNFGFVRNVFASFRYGDGDATFMIFGDLQDPPELLPDFVREWEQGGKIIAGQRTNGAESRFMFALRSCYYKLIKILGGSDQIQYYNGFGLYDRSFIDVLRQLDDPIPYFKSLVAELGAGIRIVRYRQNDSLRGHSGFNFMKNYDVAMLSITSSTKSLLRMATFIGAALGGICLAIALAAASIKLCNWESFPMGTASILVGVFLIGAVQLFFIGILGEYLLTINTRSMHHPLVVIGERLNFESTCGDLKSNSHES